MSMPCVQVKGAPGAKCLRHKGNMGIMRGSLRPALRICARKCDSGPPRQWTFYPYRVMPASIWAVIGAAVSLAKGDKINYRGA